MKGTKYEMWIRDGFITNEKLRHRPEFNERNESYEQLMAEHVNRYAKYKRPDDLDCPAFLDVWIVGSNEKRWLERSPADLFRLIAGDNLQTNYRIIIAGYPNAQDCYADTWGLNGRSMGMKAIRRLGKLRQSAIRKANVLLEIMRDNRIQHGVEPSFILKQFDVPVAFYTDCSDIGGSLRK